MDKCSATSTMRVVIVVPVSSTVSSSGGIARQLVPQPCQRARNDGEQHQRRHKARRPCGARGLRNGLAPQRRGFACRRELLSGGGGLQLASGGAARSKGIPPR